MLVVLWVGGGGASMEDEIEQQRIMREVREKRALKKEAEKVKSELVVDTQEIQRLTQSIQEIQNTLNMREKMMMTLVDEIKILKDSLQTSAPSAYARHALMNDVITAINKTFGLTTPIELLPIKT